MTRHSYRVKPRLRQSVKLPVKVHRSRAVSGMRALLPATCLALLLLSARPLVAQTSLLVYAASSLTDAFLAIEAEFESSNPQIDVLHNFAASSTLVNQLLLGAPADVIASADETRLERLLADGIVASPSTLVRNDLVLAIPADNPADLETTADLAREGLRLVLAAPGVPIRSYSDQLLEQLAQSHDYDLADVMANVVSEESNVRQVLLKIALGDADAGFVYSSDITPSLAALVSTIPLPVNASGAAVYPVAIVSGSELPEAAARYVNFLLSPAGQRIMVDNGFRPALEDAQPLPWLPCLPAWP